MVQQKNSLLPQHGNTNPYNTFKSLKVAEGNLYIINSRYYTNAFISMKLLTLQQEYHEENEAFTSTKEEKAEIIEEFNEYKQEGMKIHCPTARATVGMYSISR